MHVFCISALSFMKFLFYFFFKYLFNLRKLFINYMLDIKIIFDVITLQSLAFNFDMLSKMLKDHKVACI